MKYIAFKGYLLRFIKFPLQSMGKNHFVECFNNITAFFKHMEIYIYNLGELHGIC